MRPCCKFLFLSLVLVASWTSCLHAGGCDNWLPGPLHNQPQGINGVVLASYVWTPSGAAQRLIVGGSFTTAGGVTVNNIAAWDGASWTSLGAGTNGSVFALGEFNGELIAGGTFTTADGVAVNRIARWNGSAWQPLGTGLTQSPSSLIRCSALAVYNGFLYVGGKFTQAGGVGANNIAKWNGSSWSSPGVGVSSPNPLSDEVKALRVHNNVLYVGGWFANAGGSPASNIARCTNDVWSAMGSGTTDFVNAFSVWNNDLIVGGNFSTAGGISASHVARWTPGGTWGTLGTGIGGSAVYSFQAFNGQLVAGVEFLSTGLLGWNGSSWVNVGSGVSGSPCHVYTVNFFNGKLIAGGTFSNAGPAAVQTTNIAQWDAANWSALISFAPQVYAFELLGSRIVAGGNFTQSATTLAPGNNLLAWDGVTKSPILAGTNGTVRALKSFNTGSGPTLTRRLLVGGDFTSVNDVTSNRVAQWNEPQLTPSSWSTLGSGFNNSVYALERFNNVNYAGGSFTASGATTVNRIAQFNGTAWVAVGTGMNGDVLALKVYNGFLYAGGTFNSAGGVSTGGLARWNGTAWSSVGGFFNGIVLSLEIHNNELIIGGSYPGLAGSPNIARFNGTSYLTLGTGGTNGPVAGLRSDGTNLYAIGSFQTAGGVSANKIARWNATNGWSGVSGGIPELVGAAAIGVYRGEIHVGTVHTIFDAPDGGIAGGGAPIPGKAWVRYTPTGAPWIALNPGFQSIECGAIATFNVRAADGYTGLSYLWRKNGTPLANGPSGTGSVIAGATTHTLTITNVSDFDAGTYDVIVTNGCGNATSFGASLTLTGPCAPCPGDLNGDGSVGAADLGILLGSWGVPGCGGASPCPADLTGDGAVGAADLGTLLGNWGPC